MMRYFIGFLVTIGLIIVLILLLFHGGSKPQVPSTSKTLDSYAGTNADVRLTIDGPVNAAENHTQVQVDVSQTETTYNQIQGYNDTVVNNQNFANTQNSYAAFLFALERAGFTKGNTNSDLQDERGYCPLGDRYVFELRQGGKDLERYWATTCGGIKTYDGNVSLTVQLFQAQVPGYGTLTQDLQF